jgi:hypothetical protein
VPEAGGAGLVELEQVARALVERIAVAAVAGRELARRRPLVQQLAPGGAADAPHDHEVRPAGVALERAAQRGVGVHGRGATVRGEDAQPVAGPRRDGQEAGERGHCAGQVLHVDATSLPTVVRRAIVGA